MMKRGLLARIDFRSTLRCPLQLDSFTLPDFSTHSRNLPLTDGAASSASVVRFEPLYARQTREIAVEGHGPFAASCLADKMD